jgi:hypothetical protein
MSGLPQLGGDNCSRSAFVGGVLGAIHRVPDDWAARATDAEEVRKGADKIVSECGC